jgi:hypothetical protein
MVEESRYSDCLDLLDLKVRNTSGEKAELIVFGGPTQEFHRSLNEFRALVNYDACAFTNACTRLVAHEDSRAGGERFVCDDHASSIALRCETILRHVRRLDLLKSAKAQLPINAAGNKSRKKTISCPIVDIARIYKGVIQIEYYKFFLCHGRGEDGTLPASPDGESKSDDLASEILPVGIASFGLRSAAARLDGLVWFVGGLFPK